MECNGVGNKGGVRHEKDPFRRSQAKKRKGKIGS